MLRRRRITWLERDGDGPTRAYFGEWIDEIREKTGGSLDRMKAPWVFLSTSSERLPIKRNENNLKSDVKSHGVSGCEGFSRTRHILSLSFVPQTGIRWMETR